MNRSAFHRLCRAIAVLAAISGLFLGSFLLLSSIRKENVPMPLTTKERAFSLGTHGQYDLAGFWLAEHSNTPRVVVEVYTPDEWVITFSLSLVVPSDHDLTKMPPVFVLMPSDSYDCISDYKFAYNLDTGTQERLGGDWSTIVEVGRTSSRNPVFEVRPISIGEEAVKGRPIARYGIVCRTGTIPTTSAGLSARNFEISYIPDLASEVGLFPGIGGPLLRESTHLNGIPIRLDNYVFDTLEYTRSHIDTESLSKTPDISRGDTAVWGDQRFSEHWTVTGHVQSRWAGFLQTNASSLMMVIVAAFLGAVIGTALSNKE